MTSDTAADSLTTQILAGVSPETWVDAAPFRAHLVHLMAVGDLDPWEVAALTRLSVVVVRRLLEGRAGRRVRRVSPDTALRLIQVRPADVAALRWCLSPAEPGRAALGRLHLAGWDLPALADRLRWPLAELAALPGAVRCSRMLLVRLVALTASLPDRRQEGDDEPLAA